MRQPLRHIPLLTLAIAIVVALTAPAAQGASKGIWISSSEIAALPTSGTCLGQPEGRRRRQPGCSQRGRPELCARRQDARRRARLGANGRCRVPRKGSPGRARSDRHRGRGPHARARTKPGRLRDRRGPDRPELVRSGRRSEVPRLALQRTLRVPRRLVADHDARPQAEQLGHERRRRQDRRRPLPRRHGRPGSRRDRLPRLAGRPRAYKGFDWGDLSWQADPANPVGINREGRHHPGPSRRRRPARRPASLRAASSGRRRRRTTSGARWAPPSSRPSSCAAADTATCTRGRTRRCAGRWTGCTT